MARSRLAQKFFDSMLARKQLKSASKSLPNRPALRRAVLGSPSGVLSRWLDQTSRIRVALGGSAGVVLGGDFLGGSVAMQSIPVRAAVLRGGQERFDLEDVTLR